MLAQGRSFHLAALAFAAALWAGCGPTTSSNNSNSCSSGQTACGNACCSSGQICSNGACAYPYSTAHLYVYLCPSFNQGGCSAKYFMLDNACVPINASATPGSCYDTGFTVSGSRTYGMTSCTGCSSGCGNPTSFSTPKGFTQPTYFAGTYWYCNTPCTPPPNCP